MGNKQNEIKKLEARGGAAQLKGEGYKGRSGLSASGKG